jgi:hypothetical protein
VGSQWYLNNISLLKIGKSVMKKLLFLALVSTLFNRPMDRPLPSGQEHKVFKFGEQGDLSERLNGMGLDDFDSHGELSKSISGKELNVFNATAVVLESCKRYTDYLSQGDSSLLMLGGGLAFSKRYKILESLMREHVDADSEIKKIKDIEARVKEDMAY